MSSIRRRQIRFTVFLALIILACVTAGLIVRLRRQEAARTAETPQGETAARYHALAAGEGAEVVSNLLTTSKGQANLIFCRMGKTAEEVQAIAEAFSGSGMTPIFFSTAEQALANSEGVQAAVSAGYEIGLFLDDDGGLQGEELALELHDRVEILAQVSSRRVNSLLTNAQPSGTLPAAALANDLETIYVCTQDAALSGIQDEASAEEFLSRVRRGEILCVDLEEETQSSIAAAAALLRAASASEEDGEQAAQPQAEKAEPVSVIYTTEPAVAFTFSGLGDSEELTCVLEALERVQGTVTFFVTQEDLETHDGDVRRILEAGHALGISVQRASGQTASALLSELDAARDRIRNEFGYKGDLPVRQNVGTPSQELCEAAAAGGYTVLTQQLEAVQAEDARQTDAGQVLERVMPAENGVLQRGAIVHFQMNMFQYSQSLLGELVERMATERNVYSLRVAMDILNNTAYTYTYPVPEEAYLPEVAGKIHSGQLEGKDAFEEIRARYIGISWVNSRYFLPGFTSAEIRELDTDGLVKNDSNMVFLTFDDWGTDENITKLLDVLRKHQARATFFIRTENVRYNPNLLRAIAQEGHTIGSHTRTHYPLSNALNDAGTRFEELTEEELEAFRRDLEQSYQDLLDVIGDVRVDGRPALSLLFRPPTLAVGKNSLEAVFDSGFTYSVSGTYTTQDYKAESAQALANSMLRRTRSGAVFILHMSDNSMYTAEAVDLYLTQMESLEETYRFVGLSEALK